MAEEKAPLTFLVFLHLGKDVFAVPPFNIATAGGNRVRVRNLLNAPLEVTHYGKLVAPDPFPVGAKSPSGPVPEVTYPVDPGADVPGSVFPLQIDIVSGRDRTRVRAFAAGDDPEIIIT